MARALPVLLTEASWSQKKGTIAKIAGETGIGAQLKKVAAAYDRVDWKKFDAKEMAKTVQTPQDVDAALEEAKKHFAGFVEPLRAELVKTRNLAKKVAADFAKKALLKSSAAAPNNIAEAADAFFIELKSMDAEYAAILKLKDSVKMVDVDALVPNWFWGELDKITWFKAPAVVKFATDPSFAINLGTGKPDPSLAEIQKVAKQRLVDAINAMKVAKATQGKTIKKGEVATKLCASINAVCDNFSTMGPPNSGELGGIRGLLGYWVNIQSDATRTEKSKREESATWKAVSSLGNDLMQQENHVNKVEEASDKLRVEVSK